MRKEGIKNTDFNTLWRHIKCLARARHARGNLSYTTEKVAGEDSLQGGNRKIVRWYWHHDYGVKKATKEEEQRLCDLCESSSGMNINGEEVAIMEDQGFYLLMHMQDIGLVHIREKYNL